MATNSPQETPEYSTFREHYDRLYYAIQDPLSLAIRLFTRSVITSAVKGQMNIVGLSTLEKNSVLLSAVEMQIQTDPKMFGVFLLSLKEDPSMQSLVESMQRGLLSTNADAHGGSASVESRDGCEELSTSAVKRKCVHQDSSMSIVLGCGESVALPRQVYYQHHHSQHPPHHHLEHQVQHSSFQHPSHLFYHPSIHSLPQVWHHPPHKHQLPVQPHICQIPHYPPFQPPLEQPSYQHAEPTHPSYYQPFRNSPNPPHLQHAHPLTSKTPPHYQPHYQMPVQSAYIYKHSYQHPSPHHLPPLLGGYHQLSTFHSSPFQLHQTPFPPCCQTHFQDPVQPIYTCNPPYNPTRPQSQSPNPPPPDSPLAKYATFLRGFYTQQHATCTKWPQLDTCKYINLAVIDNVYANRTNLVRFREQTIRGCIDDILEWKAPISMTEILQPNCQYGTPYPVTQLLIEGAPGIGKSTFAWEVCQKWGQHQLFSEYSLVVLLKFRDKRVQEAKSVSELFYHPHSKLQSDIVDRIFTIGGDGLLLILEGFDEAPPSKRRMDSVFVRLFRGQELPKATVILTTRPSASAELRQLCNGVNSRRIEILGFGKKEIDEYILWALSDEQSRSDFHEYLSLYPHIHSMMYVPLNSAVVTHVYESCKSNGVVVPKTMTQLYSSLIRTLLLRYLKDKEEYTDTYTNIKGFKDFPQPMYEQFCKICKIAYTGIMSAETELIFKDLPNDFDSLGLMQTCSELYVDSGASVSYNFLHLTLQEYLAAYHISQQSRDEQVAFMKDHIESVKLEEVVRFLAGLIELGRDLWNLRGFASEAKPYSKIEGETNFVKLKILHLLFESQNPSAITGALGSDCVCFSHICHRARPFDLYVLAFCIAHSNCYWKLELARCKLEFVETFLRVLKLLQNQYLLPSTGKVKVLLLIESDPAAIHLLVDNMSQILVFHNLTHLGFTNGSLTPESCDLLSKHTDLLKHLEYLDLSCNHIGSGGAVNLVTSLDKLSNIRELNLHSADIGFMDCKVLSGLLASSKYIKVLDVGCNNMYSLDDLSLDDKIQLVMEGLSHNTSLEELNIGGSNFSAKNVLSLASVLKINTTLKKLDIRSCHIQCNDSVHLARALEENTTTKLQTLSLKGNPIGSEAFAGMLATNKSLANLNMCSCSIEEEAAVCLAKALERNSTVYEFDISDNPIGSEGAVAFAGMLTINKGIKKLNMRVCSIEGEGAVCLAQALEMNSTVSEFDVSHNPIGSEGAVALADMLAVNNTLSKLIIKHCSIQEKGAVCLAKALEKNFTVREFDISNNLIGLQGAVAFATMLKMSQCLKTLKLCDESVGVEGTSELAESLKHNATLERLVLSHKCEPPSMYIPDKTLNYRIIFI